MQEEDKIIDYIEIIERIRRSIIVIAETYKINLAQHIKNDIKSKMNLIIKDILKYFDNDPRDHIIRSSTEHKHAADFIKLAEMQQNIHELINAPTNLDENDKCPEQEIAVFINDHIKCKNRCLNINIKQYLEV